MQHCLPFTGCDYLPAFSRRGKEKPFERMVEDHESVNAFGQLGQTQEVPNHIKVSIEHYTCLLYREKKYRYDVHEVNRKRLTMLEAKLPKRGNKLKKLKSFDPVSLPPCLDVLSQKIRHTNYITHMWRNAHKRRLPVWDPCKHGWEVVDGMLKPARYTGDRVPEDLYHESEDESSGESDVEEQEESDDSSSDDDSEDD